MKWATNYTLLKMTTNSHREKTPKLKKNARNNKKQTHQYSIPRFKPVQSGLVLRYPFYGPLTHFPAKKSGTMIRRVKTLKRIVVLVCSLNDNLQWHPPAPSPIISHLQPLIHSIPAIQQRMIFGSVLSLYLSPSKRERISKFELDIVFILSWC